MKKLFDQTFFQSLFGFLVILVVSFAVIFFTNAYHQDVNGSKLRAGNETAVSDSP